MAQKDADEITLSALIRVIRVKELFGEKGIVGGSVAVPAREYEIDSAECVFTVAACLNDELRERPRLR